MRMGPFSNPEIIGLLNRYFVAVHIANEDYESGKLGEGQRAQLQTIRRSANRQGLPSGRVQIYLVDREEKVLDVLPLKRALDTEKFLTVVQAWVEKYGLPPRKNALQTAMPKCNSSQSDQLPLRIAARYKTLEKITTEDVLLLEKAEWQQFTNVDSTTDEWSIDDAVSKKILIHLYPYAQNFDLNLEQISHVELNASVLRTESDTTIVALRGRLSMSHVMYVSKGRREIHAELIGYAISKPNEKPVIKLLTVGAEYGAFKFDAWIESVSSKSVKPTAQ